MKHETAERAVRMNEARLEWISYVEELTKRDPEGNLSLFLPEIKGKHKAVHCWFDNSLDAKLVRNSILEVVTKLIDSIERELDKMGLEFEPFEARSEDVKHCETKRKLIRKSPMTAARVADRPRCLGETRHGKQCTNQSVFGGRCLIHIPNGMPTKKHAAAADSAPALRRHHHH
jgi:hypothetical protein